ncbi:hypothetical protein NPIL_584381, partial [Nephila pilipes]
NYKRSIDCLLDTIRDCNEMGIEEVTMWNGSLRLNSKLPWTIGSIFANLCDEDSAFRRG